MVWRNIKIGLLIGTWTKTSFELDLNTFSFGADSRSVDLFKSSTLLHQVRSGLRVLQPADLRAPQASTISVFWTWQELSHLFHLGPEESVLVVEDWMKVELQRFDALISWEQSGSLSARWVCWKWKRGSALFALFWTYKPLIWIVSF